VNKVIRRVAIALVILAVVAGGAFAVAMWQGDRKLERQVDVRVVPVPYTKERKALAQGKYLFETRGCAECHGTDGRGVVVVDSANGFHVKAPNITSGPGGVVAGYAEGDWVRTIRHGVAPSGRALLVMPSEDYNRMSDADFAALVAYTRNLPAVRGEPADIRMPRLLKALYAVGVIRDASEKIDHRKPPSAPVTAAASAEHGAYVAQMCKGCHGASLEGGPIGGAPPEWPPAANLTPAGAMARYDTPEKFIAMMRTGKRPDGSDVSTVMPFMSLRNMNDTDLQALHLFLRSLPARAS
jgi:mono/diheme cytochrome c family protein